MRLIKAGASRSHTLALVNPANIDNMTASQAVARAKPVLTVLEDDSAVRESLRFSLEIDGFKTHTYASPNAFLNDPKRAVFDCLIVDYHLPEMTGLDVVDKLREQGNFAPAILLTGNPTPNIRRRASVATVTVVEKVASGAVIANQTFTIEIG